MRHSEETTDAHLELVIFRLRDVCVRVQSDLKKYLRTAAIEPRVRIRATFEWLRKRDVRICLLSDFNRSETELLLARLGWEVGPDALVQLVLTDQRSHRNPVRYVHEQLEMENGARTVVVADTPKLLREGEREGCPFLIGICNGKSSYQQLLDAPHHVLLDHTLQLPNYLLQNLPESGSDGGVRTRSLAGLPLLWLVGSRRRG